MVCVHEAQPQAVDVRPGGNGVRAAGDTHPQGVEGVSVHDRDAGGPQPGGDAARNLRPLRGAHA